MPWGALVLLGSSFVLAQAFDLPKSAGARRALALAVDRGRRSPVSARSRSSPSCSSIALVVTFAGELASNTAMAALLIPIGFSLAPRLGVEPLVYGFTICLGRLVLVHAAGRDARRTRSSTGRACVPLRTLMATGLVLDLCGAALIPLLVAVMR